MTTAAQQAMRRTMEVYSASTRFALACNTSSKIAEAIQSRCAILRFTRLTDAQVLLRLEQVCKAESVEYNDSGLAALVFTAEGDMRNAINNLQSTFSGFNSVTETTVLKVCDQPHPQIIKNILQAVLIQEPRNLDTALATLQNLYQRGYAPVDLCATIFKVAKTLDIPEPLKLDTLKQIGLTHMRIADGAASLLQLSALLASLYTM
uniref:Replication factor C C-terminal domain-containing protein n=1 Tax=Aureoumbra lagunensis TaxID=44058 RepID=A0A6S8AXJ3_9STRA